MDPAEEGKPTNPWLNVFCRPKEVAKSFCMKKPNYHLGWLSGVFGLLWLLEFMQNISAGMHYRLWVILVTAVVLAVPAGYIALSVSAAFIFWTGKMLGGKATYEAVRSALAWSKVPEVVGLLGWLVLLIVYGANVFIPAFVQKTYSFEYFTLPTGIMIFQVIFAVWGFVVLLHLLGKVQGFSPWLALINVILKAIVLAVIATILLWFFTSVTFVGTIGVKVVQEMLKF